MESLDSQNANVNVLNNSERIETILDNSDNFNDSPLPRWLQNATIVGLNPQGTSNLKLYSDPSLKLRPLTRVNLISVRLGLGWG